MIDLESMKKEVLVFDIECYSDYDINKENDQYLRDARTKWVGFYSYKTERYYDIKAIGNEGLIQDFISRHKILVSFNGDDFDLPILKNNKNLMFPEKGYFNSVDLMKILGKGIGGFKNRGFLMGYKFKKNNLRHMAEIMKLNTQKGDIDYTIFKKDYWTPEEEKEIKKYLRADVEVTKQMFDILWDYWKVFIEFINEKNIKNLSWIKSASGALSYKVLCNFANLPEEYGDSKGEKEEMGGLVLDPAGEEFTDVWYMDFASLYPHIMMMFNIFGNPTLRPDCKKWFTGNSVFKIRGKYAIDEQHLLSKEYQHMYIERKKIKHSDPPTAFAYKILLNGGYGAMRSTIFKSMYYEHSGYDICWIGQQLNEIIAQFFEPVGFMSVFGDTDSRGLKYIGEKPLTIEEQYKLIVETERKMNKYIMDNVPFPSPSFNLESETGNLPIKYMMFVKGDDDKFLKKNYCYVYFDEKEGEYDVHITGLPIKKDNSTKLGPHIFKKYIKPKMLEEFKGKFDREWVENLIKKEAEENMELLVQEYRPKPFESYSFTGKKCLNAQISNAYLNGKEGVISLIKNNRVGKAGGSFKYCTIEEAREQNLQSYEIDLEKVYNELNPFVKGGLHYKKSGKKQPKMKSGFFTSDKTESSTFEVGRRGFF